jgi:hypothetical protein
MKKLLFFVLLLFLFTSCNTQNCDPINNKKFNSYYEAKQYVQTFDFQLSEEENLQRSSWMKKANYYSYYIYRNVPMEVWQGFKNADSPGAFYNENIKGRFILVLDK